MTATTKVYDVLDSDNFVESTHPTLEAARLHVASAERDYTERFPAGYSEGGRVILNIRERSADEKPGLLPRDARGAIVGLIY